MADDTAAYALNADKADYAEVAEVGVACSGEADFAQNFANACLLKFSGIATGQVSIKGGGEVTCELTLTDDAVTTIAQTAKDPNWWLMHTWRA